MFRRLSIKQQFFLVTSFLIIGCIAMSVTIIVPSVRHMNTLGTDIRDIQKELEQDYKETQDMRRTLRELEDVLSEISIYETMAMPIGDELAVITELEHLAKEHTLSQTLGATYHGANDSVGLPYYTFSIVVHGTFENIFTYLQTIEAKSYYVLINSIDLSKAGENNTTLRFDARIYVQNT
jgi:hypothetical protein